MNMLVSIVYSSFLVVAAVGMFVVDFFDHDVQQDQVEELVQDVKQEHVGKDGEHLGHVEALLQQAGDGQIIQISNISSGDDCKTLMIEKELVKTEHTEPQPFRKPNFEPMELYLNQLQLQKTCPLMVRKLQFYVCPVCKGKFYQEDHVKIHLAGFHKMPQEFIESCQKVGNNLNIETMDFVL